MNCSDWNEKLHEYADRSLSPREAAALEAHLAQCPACRAELASLRALLSQAAALKKEINPARDLWPAIQGELTPASEPPAKVLRPRWWLPLAMATAAAVVIAGVAVRWDFRTFLPRATWSVVSIVGAPLVGDKNFQGETRLHVGQWLETDGASRAKLAVGSIGEVKVEPNSRLRLIDTSATEHRVELERGTMSALIWAPPRLFFVNTPSATAIDLGCAYTLTVDDRGSGLLRVTSGYVALEHDGLESIIPAGLMCTTRRGTGPGTPFAADAPVELRAALERFDFEKGGAASLGDVLAHVRSGDAIMLWHLLGRAAAAQRGEVFDALAKMETPPPSVTRTGIVAGDPAMRYAWAVQLGLGALARR